MKPKHKLFLISLLAILIMSSCVTRKKLTYLQYSGTQDNSLIQTGDANMSVTPSDYKIMPYDYLFIRVITPDPQWSALFNTMPSSGAITGESASLLSYPVDTNGDIEIPFVGKLNVEGKTLAEIKIQLDLTFENYLNDAAITVKLVNNYISILGEVRTPGRYPLTKDRINVFEALSMAGDLGDYSNRQKVQLIRPTQYGPIVKEFSLSDRSILTSEFYYLMPNDILYAKPMTGRTFQMNSSIISVTLSTITTILALFVFFRPGA